jgi:hypothetical protein
LFVPLPVEETVKCYGIRTCDTSAIVAAFSERRPLQFTSAGEPCCVFVARVQSVDYILDVNDPDLEDEWTVFLSVGDLALLGDHAEAGGVLSARNLLAWRQRYPRNDDDSQPPYVAISHV